MRRKNVLYYHHTDTWTLEQRESQKREWKRERERERERERGMERESNDLHFNGRIRHYTLRVVNIHIFLPGWVIDFTRSTLQGKRVTHLFSHFLSPSFSSSSSSPSFLSPLLFYSTSHAAGTQYEAASRTDWVHFSSVWTLILCTLRAISGNLNFLLKWSTCTYNCSYCCCTHLSSSHCKCHSVTMCPKLKHTNTHTQAHTSTSTYIT